MPSKTEEYLALAQRTANGLTRYWESWTDYLTTASRLYKYPFADQLMIYAQRPDATACAEFDIWRNRMNRYVRRGSKGIALLDESSGLRKNCTRRPTLPWLALRPPTAVISTIWRWATCLSVSTRSTTKRTTSWDQPVSLN